MADASEPASATAEVGIDAVAEAESQKVEGNALLAKGDYADACKRYDDGLLALLRANPDSKERVDEVRLALHLNASLAHIRRGNLASAVEHASGALAIDPRSAKALYRRGSARAALAEHRSGSAEDGRLARQDLQAALEIEPTNTAVREKLQAIRSQAKEEEKQTAESQKAAFKNIFASKQALYSEESKPVHKAEIREESDEQAPAALSACNVFFHYERGEPVLEDLSLCLRQGRCVGMFGNNATGKSTLARILCGRLTPVKGSVFHHLESDDASSSPNYFTVFWVLSSLAVAVAVLIPGLGLHKAMHWYHCAGILLLLMIVGVLLKYILDRGASQHKKQQVIFLSSEASDKEHIPDKATIEDVVGKHLPKTMDKAVKRKQVISLLEAGGFQMYNQETGEPVGNPQEYIRDGLTYGALSGGQKHLMYVLRGFAACPEVLLCDELLGGLDAIRQPRVLHMLNRLCKERGIAVLYITTELHQLRVVSDSIGVMSAGQLCELGPAEEVLESPKHPVTKEYVSSYRGLPGCQVIGGKLAQNYAAVADDPALLSSAWLPMIRKRSSRRSETWQDPAAIHESDVRRELAQLAQKRWTAAGD
mmetsp:Transcript_7903/g.17464  ORF Transcript_7903/g.17464 Transcript_7903/m.17464 type:complete len:595 (-) Transcript_7903:255-2039(-)